MHAGLRAEGLGFQVSGLGVCVLGSGFGIWCLGCELCVVDGLGFRALDFGFRFKVFVSRV